MRLIDLYHMETDGLGVREKREARALWFNTAKRFLNYKCITSDPVKRYPPPTVDHTRAFMPRWLQYDVSELEELYRLTKPHRQ